MAKNPKCAPKRAVKQSLSLESQPALQDLPCDDFKTRVCYKRVHMNRAIGKERLESEQQTKAHVTKEFEDTKNKQQFGQKEQVEQSSKDISTTENSKNIGILAPDVAKSVASELALTSVGAALQDLSRLREGALGHNTDPAEPEKRSDWMLRCLGADTTVMLELDPNGQVIRTECHGGGHLGDWWRVAMISFKGANFVDLIDKRDQKFFMKILEDTSPGDRILPRTLRLAWAGARAPTIVIQGLRDAKGEGGLETCNYRISVSLSNLSRGLHRATAGRDPEYGVLETDTFVKAAVSRILVGEAARRRRQLTFLDLQNATQLRKQMTGSQRQTLNHEIGGYLQAVSIGGDSACLIAENCFAILHTTDVSRFSMSRALTNICKRIHEQELGKIRSASIDIAVTGASEDEVAEILRYAINSFVTHKATDNADSEIAKMMMRHTPKLGNLLSEHKSSGGQLSGRWTSLVRASGRFSLPENFFMVFQPVVSLIDMTPKHYEALARFSNGDKTSNVIRFVEQAGLTEDFDLSVVERLCRFAVNKSNLDTAPIAVNLSARSLQGECFIDQLLTVLDTHEMPGDKMMFEITETSDIGALARVNTIVQKLRHRGHKVSLDDFGSGAAAFHYLRALEVDTIKIDGIYINNLPSSLRDKVVVRAIAGMCQGLEMETVAEMVETPEQLDELRNIGVKLGQGFLFGRPQELTLEQLSLH